MARPVKIRKLITPHRELFLSFDRRKKSSGEEIVIFSEEYEALKLVDYEKMHHLSASKLMGISRPTLTRIYKSARFKVSKCLVEKKGIKVMKGNSILGYNWYRCEECKATFNIPDKKTFDKSCPVCKSIKFKIL